MSIKCLSQLQSNFNYRLWLQKNCIAKESMLKILIAKKVWSCEWVINIIEKKLLMIIK